jgi:hypothetical protein
MQPHRESENVGKTWLSGMMVITTSGAAGDWLVENGGKNRGSCSELSGKLDVNTGV